MRPLLPFTVALSLGFASAQTQPQDIPALPVNLQPLSPAAPVEPATPALPVSAKAITDVPASHWAYDAIKMLISKGIVLGYPDGTFRGDQTITRNEMAVMFARLLESNTLQPLLVAAAAAPTPPAAQLPVISASEPVSLPAVTSVPTLSQADVDLITNAIKDLSAEIMTVNVRLKDALSDIDNIKQRLATSEATLQQVVQVSATHVEVQGAVQASAAQSSANLSALQSAVTSSLEAKTDTAVTAALDSRVSSLEASEHQRLQDAATRAAADLAAKALADKAAADQAVFVQPGQQTEATFTPESAPRTSVGGGVSKTLGGEGMTIQVVAERRRVVGGLNLRAGASFNATAQSYEIEGMVTGNFGKTGLFDPYVGAGVGMMFSPGVTDSTETARDLYAGALAGVDYQFTDTLGIYAEAQGRYALSHKGTASGTTGLGLKIGIGAKLLF